MKTQIKNRKRIDWLMACYILLLTFCLILIISPKTFAQGDWKIVNPANSPSARFGSSLTPLPDGNLLLFGGQESAQKIYNDLHSYNNFPIELWTFLTIANTLPSERAHHTSWFLNGKLYAHGGIDENQLPLNDLWNYDPTTKEWTFIPQTEPMPAERYHHKSSVTNDGKTIISGGYNGAITFNDIWLYDHVTNQWTLMNSNIPVAAESHISEIVDDNLFVFTGGQGFKYNLNDNIWTSGLQAPPLKGGAVSVLGENDLGHNIIFIFGGVDMQNNFSDKVYEYNTETGILTEQTEPMPLPMNKMSGAIINQLKDYVHMTVVFFGGMTGSWANLIPMNQTWEYTVGEASSIKDWDKNTIFEIYPNPATNSIEIQLGSYSGETSFEIIDIHGKIVMGNKIVDNQKIDVSGFSAGTYTLRLKSEKSICYKKLIIR